MADSADITRSERSSLRVLKTIGVMLIILGIMVIIANQAVDFTIFTEPFEAIKSTLPQTQSSTNDSSAVIEAAENLKDDLGITKAQMYYITFRSVMENVEQTVVNFNNKFLISIVILIFFAVKAFISVVPVSFTCLLAGAIFPFPVAVIINLIGISEIFTIKYFMGVKAKKNQLERLLQKSDFLWEVVTDPKNGGEGNSILLFTLRLMPVVPANPVSAFYGHRQFNVVKYIIISDVGYMFKLVAFTSLGYNIYDPFSSEIFLILGIILVISGLTVMLVAKVIKQLEEGNYKSTKLSF